LLFLFLCASLLSGLRTSRSCTQFTSVMDCVLHARARNSLMWFPADASSFLSVTEKRLQPGGGEGGVKAQERRTLAVQAARGKGKGKGKAASAGPSSKPSPQYCLVRAVYKKKTISTLVCVHLVLISWLHLRSFALTLLLSLFSLLCVLASSQHTRSPSSRYQVRAREVAHFQRNLNQLMRGHMSATMKKRKRTGDKAKLV
jgi:hypothetical protein